MLCYAISSADISTEPHNIASYILAIWVIIGRCEFLALSWPSNTLNDKGTQVSWSCWMSLFKSYVTWRNSSTDRILFHNLSADPEERQKTTQRLHVSPMVFERHFICTTALCAHCTDAKLFAKYSRGRHLPVYCGSTKSFSFPPNVLAIKVLPWLVWPQRNRL